MLSFLLSPAILYLLKMMTITAILYGYYWVFFRNASFHPYKRWYLLGSVVLSFLLPFLHFPVPAGWVGADHYSGLLATVSGSSVGDPARPPLPTTDAAPIHFYSLLAGWTGIWLFYGLVAVFFIVRLCRSLLYLLRLSRKYASVRIEGILFFQTAEPGTPFSFLDRLFWNRDLALDSLQGRSVFRHEWYHIRQRHTLDILLLEGVRSLCWCNPFFHLVLREIKVVHEFLADRYALSAGPGGLTGPMTGESGAGPDRYAYAEWLVWQTAGAPPAVAHSFFHTHLKRRITMITQSNQPSPRYISRVMALPLSLLLCCAFAAKPPDGGAQSHPGRGPVVTDSSHLSDLVGHYLHQLRYPPTALEQGQEETIWFSVNIGDNNQLKGFMQYETAPDLKGRNAYKITVTSLPSRLPGSTGAAPLLTDQNKKTVFLEQARKASESLAENTHHIYPSGEYFFTIIFKLEKPVGSDSTLSISIDSPPGKAAPSGR
jgi:beta-lactamase regulating signal transducer with metallopeptidase domain